MTTCLGKSCSFGLPRVSSVNRCHLIAVAQTGPLDGLNAPAFETDKIQK